MRYLKLFEDFDQNLITSIDELKSKLIEYEIPIDFWGKGDAKTVEHLFDEIVKGECRIEPQGSHIVRFIEFVGVRIFYKDKDSQVWYLKEDRQEFRDGRIRRRNMPASVSEKMIFGEDPLISAIRGIKEELDVQVEAHQLIKRRPLYYNGGSQSYPGLRAKYIGHQFTCYLTDEQFNLKGYVEVQKDKSTFFIWEKQENF